MGTLRSMARELFYACYNLYMRAWFFIIGYLGLVSFHFYYLITLYYITSCVLRPPWGHGIRCRLRQPLHGQVFEIWLIFRYHHASSSGKRPLWRLDLIQLWIWMIGIAPLMMDDPMLSDFSIYHTYDVALGHIFISIEIYRSSWSCMLIPTYEIYSKTMTCLLSYHDLLREPLLSHSVKLTLFDIWMSSCFFF